MKRSHDVLRCLASFPLRELGSWRGRLIVEGIRDIGAVAQLSHPAGFGSGARDQAIRRFNCGNNPRRIRIPFYVFSIPCVPGNGTLSRQRSRVRVPSSPPFLLKELSDVTPKTPRPRRFPPGATEPCPAKRAR